MRSISAHVFLLLGAAFMGGACGMERSTDSPVGPTAPSGPVPPAVDITGQYVLTIGVSPACATAPDEVSGEWVPLPPAAQTRSYDAAITQHPSGQLEVVLTPAECGGGWYEEPGICRPLPSPIDCRTRVMAAGGCALGSVSGHEMAFAVPPESGTSRCGGGDYWFEQFTATEVFEACGTWMARIADISRIDGRFAGTFRYWRRASPDSSPPRLWESLLYCPSGDHQFALLRR